MARYKSGRASDFNEAATRKMMQINRRAIASLISEAQAPVHGSLPPGVPDSVRTGLKAGRMPVDTGFLRNSFVSGLNGSASPAHHGVVIASMKLGDGFMYGWTAEYARAVEYGSSGRRAHLFATTAANHWAEHVEAAVRAVR